MSQSFEREITTAGSKASYDVFAKRLLAQKIILAHILVNTVKDFANMKPEQVVLLIEEPEIASVPALPGQTNNPEVITGCNTESNVPYEGSVTFDIRFFVWIPGKREKVKVIVDIEVQKKFSPGYDLVTRGIFYGSRLISAQLDTEFSIPNYNDIKKVFSIWLCANAPQKAENTITEFHVSQNNIVGNAENIGRYDLLSVIMVGLSKKLVDGNNDELKLHRLLGTLFAAEMKPEEKKSILSTEFEIPMTNDIERSVETMCNLSEAIEEQGIEKGMEQGMEQGKYVSLYNLVKSGVITDAQAAASENIPVATFLEKLKDYKLEL